MTRQHRWVVTAAICAALATTSLQARQDATKPPPPPKLQARVDVVLARYQGDKKVSSLPSAVYVTTNGNFTTLRLGVDVPVGTTTTTRAAEGNRAGESTTRPSYKNVGTNVDCNVTGGVDGRFEVTVSMDDSSIFSMDQDPRAAAKASDTSSFRTFTARNTIPMKDGQTTVFASVTDKVSGEVVKLEVTFTLIK